MSSVTGAADGPNGTSVQPCFRAYKPSSITRDKHLRFLPIRGAAILSLMPPLLCSTCGASVASTTCPQCGAVVENVGAVRTRRAVVLGVLGLGASVGLSTLALVRTNAPGAAGGHRASAAGKGAWETEWLAGAAGLRQASAEQKTSQKVMLVYFYADWCGYCRKLESGVLATAEGRSALRSVIKVRINAEAGRDEQQLAGELGIRGYPTLLLVSPEGDMRRIRTPQSPDELKRVLG